MIESFLIWKHQGKQYIPDLTSLKLPTSFLGRPEIEVKKCADSCRICLDNCPTEAITVNPVTLDFGKCLLCGECQRFCPENKITFTNDYQSSTNSREELIIKEGQTSVSIRPEEIRKEIISLYGRSLKLRQISAGGDSSAEWELGACGNANFDMGRFGIEFVASPRHADGIVITGPITQNMAEAVKICYEATPNPKIVVLVGTDAISGGIFADGPALNRTFLENLPIDLFVPGNPPHPLTFINGILELTRSKNKVVR
jgi:Ni,Fe-hydrogenase III small subunit/ferredoxin